MNLEHFHKKGETNMELQETITTQEKINKLVNDLTKDTAGKERQEKLEKLLGLSLVLIRKQEIEDGENKKKKRLVMLKVITWGVMVIISSILIYNRF